MGRYPVRAASLTPRRAVFLDRDGVLNRPFIRGGKPYAPQTLEEFEILPGVEKALASLRRAGFLLIVVTNQPDIARGYVRREVLDAMHQRLFRELPLDDIKVCCATEDSKNDCYKPKPGMLLQAAKEHDIDLAQSFIIGDRWRDVGAGKAAGCRTIFIDRHYDEPLLEQPDLICDDLAEAAVLIMKQEGKVDHGGSDGKADRP